MSAVQLPIERVHFTSRSYDEAVDFVRQAFFDDRLRVSGGTAAGEFTSQRASAGTAIASSRTRTTLSFTFHNAPVDYLQVSHVRRGALRQIAGEEDLRLSNGDVFLARPWVPMTNVINRFAIQSVQIPMAAVEDVAATRAEADPPGVRFHSGRPVSTALARYWRSTVTMVADELGAADSVFAEPLVSEQMQRQLAAAALAAFPNTTMTTEHRSSGAAVALTVVRRAAAYIEAHAGQPIRLADIANAAGTRPRTLQHAFNRHYGTTPVGYLTRVRLEGAHHELQAADPSRGATVGAIARRWGFASQSRFGVLYRTAYGRPPGHTLRS